VSGKREAHGLKPTRFGGWAELVAASFFASIGWEVYPASGSHNTGDLVALNPVTGSSKLVEVKGLGMHQRQTGWRYALTTPSVRAIREKAAVLDLVVLVSDNNRIWLADAAEIANSPTLSITLHSEGPGPHRPRKLNTDIWEVTPQ
jgi:hypothetical protein